jgi:hypothetical protein
LHAHMPQPYFLISLTQIASHALAQHAPSF